METVTTALCFGRKQDPFPNGALARIGNHTCGSALVSDEKEVEWFLAEKRSPDLRRDAGLPLTLGRQPGNGYRHFNNSAFVAYDLASQAERPA